MARRPGSILGDATLGGPRSLSLKRMLDLAMVVLSAPVSVPVMAVLALLVHSRLGGPILFRQVRPGKNGKLFRLVKFRTMTDARDAEGQLLPDAERLPAFGSWLRSSSLDELPELWNVLKGEMSLVGPRPLLVEYLPLYSPEQARRHEVPPGITGWAQINGRNALSWKDRFALDVWYVDHRSQWLDLKILILTVLTVLRRDGVSGQGHVTMPPFTSSRSDGPLR